MPNTIICTATSTPKTISEDLKKSKSSPEKVDVILAVGAEILETNRKHVPQLLGAMKPYAENINLICDPLSGNEALVSSGNSLEGLAEMEARTVRLRASEAELPISLKLDENKIDAVSAQKIKEIFDTAVDPKIPKAVKNLALA
ncbi:MAG: hypothetical protein JWM96_336 [Alphaproteobacteria bacterium]|nr:hypothetical protein [Alphaproteobacteria bacterium]